MSSPLTNAGQLLTAVNGVCFGRMLWLIAAILTFYHAGRAYVLAYLSCVNVPDALSAYHPLPVT